jgi:protein-L-isoaspartate(D-aspartate) O-methyltransferase
VLPLDRGETFCLDIPTTYRKSHLTQKGTPNMTSLAPGDDEGIAHLHRAFVDNLKRAGQIRTAPVEAAFRAVPRHLFVPGFALEDVYSDRAINVKPGASSSQPTVIANMLEELQLEPGQRVLEIATGTGYNAALISHILGDEGQVTTVEIDEELAQHARLHLAAAGLGHVKVICADGGLGCPAGDPYDRIIVTTGAWDIAPAWWEQLQRGGRLLVPLAILGPSHQLVVAFERTGDHLESVSTYSANSMMGRGTIAQPDGATNMEGQLRISAYPQKPGRTTKSDPVVLEKRWTRLVLSGWP